MGLNFAVSERPVIEALKLLQDNPTNQGEGILIEAGAAFQDAIAAVKAHGGKAAGALRTGPAEAGQPGRADSVGLCATAAKLWPACGEITIWD